MNELFSYFLSRVPKEKRKELLLKIYPQLLSISEALHEMADDEDDDGQAWLQQLKADYKFLNEEQRLNRLFE